MRTCERCKQPLVDDRAGFSADGRLVCTRSGCQYVEEINRRIDEGSLTLAPTEEFEVKVEFPTKEAVKGLTITPYIEAVILTPLPETDDEDDAKTKQELLNLIDQPARWPFCPHDMLISTNKYEGQSYCECCQTWLGPPPVDGKLCPGCGGPHVS